MDYVNNFLNIYYSEDKDMKIYEIFINFAFNEISRRMNTTTSITDIIKSFQRIGINNDINELLNNMINFVKMENLSRLLRENLNHEPLVLILEDYANKYCNINNFPKKEINDETINMSR
ncbi:MAG: hypothetical protein E7163_01155 [Firmicutes bacterium]|nr:hypothetical protein [Bacillota bacterium]